MTAKLITISFSHYCEKARWALDRCGVPYEEEAHLPVFHYLVTYRSGGTRTVPVLVDGETVVRDSTDIVAWADKHRPGSLIPPAGARDALAIEDDLDNHLGPATRRWAYFHLLPNREADGYVVAGVPRWERSLLTVSRPLAIAFLRRGLELDEAGVERSRKQIEDTFARVDEILARRPPLPRRRSVHGRGPDVCRARVARAAAARAPGAGAATGAVPADCTRADRGVARAAGRSLRAAALRARAGQYPARSLSRCATRSAHGETVAVTSGVYRLNR